MALETMACMSCGVVRPLHLIDMKPPHLAGPNHSLRDLEEAADRGKDFTLAECLTCYGPGWCAGDPVEVRHDR